MPNNPNIQVDTHGDISSSGRPSVRFSLPDISPMDASPANTVRTKPSEASLTSKPKPPSILSGGSRSSARARHALLKPSVTEAQPVDTDLPIPPVLSPIASIPEQAMPETQAREMLKVAMVTEFGTKVDEEMKPNENAADPNLQSLQP